MRVITLVIFLNFSSFLLAQNEARIWYFGDGAGLNFSTNPPTVLNNSAMSTTFGCTSICNPNGNLLFYTNGVTVWNQNHQIMANGTGLLGLNSAQSSLVVKLPGSINIYYLFTVRGAGLSPGLHYSIIDMSLAAGMGSVTVKNATLYASGVTEKLAATKHCNQTDIWVMAHELNNNNYRTYLLTSAGLNTVAVVSSAGATQSGPSGYGCMKFSPNGKKFASVYTESGSPGGVTFALCEYGNFDNLTGQLTYLNWMHMSTSPLNNGWQYGCEFSPNSSKLYVVNLWQILQLNACSPSWTTTGLVQMEGVYNGNLLLGSMQLAPNGKIYIARPGDNHLGVIHNPNAAGNLCNISYAGVSTGSNICRYGLPNFVSNYFEQAPSPFTYSISPAPNCGLVSFLSPSLCPAFSNYSVSSLAWNFGDPSSGPLNTSTLSNPSHSFTAPGTYTVRLVSNYHCGRSDTLYQSFQIGNTPSLSILSNSVNCSIATVTAQAFGGIGPYSYTWSVFSQTGSVANIGQGVHSVIIFDQGSGCLASNSVQVNVLNLSGQVSTTNQPCFNLSSAQASIGISGGSGTYNYTWSVAGPNAPLIGGLLPGTYSVFVQDAVHQCTYSAAFNITSPPPLLANITSTAYNYCDNQQALLFANALGGTSPYQFQWVNGPMSNIYTLSVLSPGTHVYSLNVTDLNGCIAQNTVSIFVQNTPTLVSGNFQTCLNSPVTLSVSGAVSYTWFPGGASGSVLNFTPISSAVFTVTGAISNCTNSIQVHLTVHPLPQPVIVHNAPLCSGQTLFLNANGAFNYFWTGPSGYTSNLQNPVNTNISLALGGNYFLTGTSVNGCTASTSAFIQVIASPTLQVSGNFTICSGNSSTLMATGANTYSWSTGSTFNSVVLSPSATSVYTLTGYNGSCSSSQLLQVVVSKCVGLEESGFSQNNILVYPNPFFTQVRILSSETLSYFLLDLSGRLLLSGKTEPHEFILDLNLLPSGNYILDLKSETQEKKISLIKKYD